MKILKISGCDFIHFLKFQFQTFGFFGFLEFKGIFDFYFILFCACDLKCHLRFMSWVSFGGISSSVIKILYKIMWSSHCLPSQLSHLENSIELYDFHYFLLIFCHSLKSIVFGLEISVVNY